MAITKLNQIIEALQGKPKKRLVAAYANDAHSIEAVNEAVDKGIVTAILVGDEETIKKVCAEHQIDSTKFRIVHEPNDQKAASKAVALINAGEADILMKGLVSTDKYMRAILNKENGLLPPKAILSHIAVLEIPTYHKLLIISDVAVLPAPDLNQKIAMTNYVIATANKLGIALPKIAINAATEQMSPGMQACVDAAIISKLGDRGQIKGALIDGPLAIDVTVDMESVQIKGLKSEVAGDADGIVFPNIESANAFYKATTKFAKSELAAIVVGARVPCVLSSRGDSSLTKLYSIALAALSA